MLQRDAGEDLAPQTTEAFRDDGPCSKPCTESKPCVGVVCCPRRTQGSIVRGYAS